jgi:hypothetical protein
MQYKLYFTKGKVLLYFLIILLLKLLSDNMNLNKTDENIISHKEIKRSAYELAYIDGNDNDNQIPIDQKTIMDLITKAYDPVEEDKIENRKYVLWSCETSCGGWGDRMKAITSSFMLSVLLKRRFRLKVTHPCNFQVMFQGSNKYFWNDPFPADPTLKEHKTLTLGFNIIVIIIVLSFFIQI